MLLLDIPNGELWDEAQQRFIYTNEQTLRLEHSLVSISKWESIYNKPFVKNKEMTFEETISYIQCMTLNQHVSANVYKSITKEHIKQVNHYIDSPSTATKFSKHALTSSSPTSNEEITAELLYYQMIALNIPMECQKWHLNRLLTLIKLCNLKNQPQEKRRAKDIMSENARINAERRKRYNSKG